MGAGSSGGGSVGVGSRHGGKHTRKLRGRNVINSGLMLASMLDILMAILFFLMKNYSQIQSDFTVGKDISLPYSSSQQPPKPALQLVVTQKAILLDNEPIAEIINGDIEKNAMHTDQVTIKPLLFKLKEKKDRSMVQNQTEKDSFIGSIVMQADKNLQFSVLKKIIYTAGVSDFVMFKLALLKKDEG